MTDNMIAARRTRAESWLLAWDSQGTHRTGTPGDHAGADWLAAEVAALGATPVVESFALDRLDPVEAWVAVDGTRIEATPVFDSPGWLPECAPECAPESAPECPPEYPFSHDILTAPLGPHGIEVTTLSPQAVYTEAYRAMRLGARHRALVIVCQGANPGLGLLNAEQFRTPYGAPALHVSTEFGDFLRAAEQRGAQAEFVSRVRRTPTEARNVVVNIPGRDRTRPPLVVMTPRSSWWQSTSERGGGLVCWLETLRALLADPPACDVVMTANSGHELGHLGLDAFIEHRPGWDVAGGATWVHYGANLGATGGQLSVMSASDDLRRAMRTALDAAGQPPEVMAPPTQVPSGETRDIHRAGGRYVTLVGSNPLFHLPRDRWPYAVDVDRIVRIAAGAAAMVRDLCR